MEIHLQLGALNLELPTRPQGEAYQVTGREPDVFAEPPEWARWAGRVDQQELTIEPRLSKDGSPWLWRDNRRDGSGFEALDKGVGVVALVAKAARVSAWVMSWTWPPVRRRCNGLVLRASRIAWRGETPDHASIWRFSQTTKASVFRRRCFRRRIVQLDALGLMVKRIALVDGGCKRPTYGDGGLNRRDPDARVTMKWKKTHFAYKAHLGISALSGQDRSPSSTVLPGRSADPGRRASYFADKASAT